MFTAALACGLGLPQIGADALLPADAFFIFPF